MLSKTAKKLYDDIRREYSIDDSAGMLLLKTVAESYDQYQSALKQCKEQGYTITDRYGQIKSNPITTVMRDSKSAMLQSLKQLNLDFSSIDKHSLSLNVN